VSFTPTHCHPQIVTAIMASVALSSKETLAGDVQQTEKLSPSPATPRHNSAGPTAVQATIIIPSDPTIEIGNARRLPIVPSEGAEKLNQPKQEMEDDKPCCSETGSQGVNGQSNERRFSVQDARNQSKEHSTAPRSAVPRQCTTSVFPPLPLWVSIHVMAVYRPSS
jgi:hypothetical protein